MERYSFDSHSMPDKSHDYYDDVYEALSYATWHYSSYGRSVTKTT